MKRPILPSCWLALLVLAAVPVFAQGQTPTSPTQTTPPGRRVGAGLIGFGQNQNSGLNNGANQQGNGDLLGRSSLKDKHSKGGLKEKEKEGDNAANDQPAADKKEEKKPEKADKGAAGGSGGGPTVITGGSKGAAPGLPGLPKPGDAKPAAAPGAPGAATGNATAAGAGSSGISVTGEPNAEPVQQRKLKYADVPDDGAENKITDEGPMPLSQFVAEIGMSTNWSIVTSEKAKEVQLPYFSLVEVTPKTALELLKFVDIYYEYKEVEGTKFLYVMTKEEYNAKNFGDAEPEEFKVAHADSAYIESAFKALLSKSGRMIADNRSGIIYVWDTQDNLEQIRKTFKDLDTPMEKRTFSIQYADLADVQTAIKDLTSKSGTVLADPRTGTLIVWDAPHVLDQVSDTIKHLDIPLQARTFEIAHANAEDLTDSLQVLLTERGTIQVDPRTNSLVVTDIPARVEKMADYIKNIDRDLETRTWTIKYADIDFVADQLESYIPSDMGDIVVNDKVHQITVTGLPARLDKIDELVQTWDIKRRQVLIEAYIVEVNNDIEQQFNVNWSYFGSKGNSPITFNANEGFKSDSTDNLRIGQLPYSVPLYGALQLGTDGKITRPIVKNTEGKNVIDYIAGNKVGATLDYLDKMDKATILSSPRVVVQDGEEATFENATQVPYVSASTIYSGYNTPITNGNGNGTGGVTNPNVNPYAYSPNNTNRIEFIDVGTILNVLPYISEDKNILLDIEAEDSTFILQTVLSNGTPSTVPQKTVRRAETQLRVASGETVVLGGLRKDSSQKASSKTPVLGDLPLVGRLFRYPNKKSTNNSLLLFLTTTIVDEHTHPESLELAKAEESISEASRHNEKNIWGRIQDDIAKGKNEVFVTIGQSGNILSEGEVVTFEDLKAHLFDLAEKKNITIVLRKHPRAPADVVTAVTEAAMEANLNVKFSDAGSPIVPDFQETPAPTPKATNKKHAGKKNQAPAAEVIEASTENKDAVPKI